MAVTGVPLNDPVLRLGFYAIKSSHDRLVSTRGYLEMSGV
jgi:hypothetical protein